MVKEDKLEKVYITRDEDSNDIWVWLKPFKKEWVPTKLKDCGMVNWQRYDMSIENSQCYTMKDFKKKFGFIIPRKKKICKRIPVKLLNNEDYKQFSKDGDRKK